MSSMQISAILYLLLAFGVPQQTVNNVQSILERATPASHVVSQIQLAPDTGGIGGVGALPQEADCTPSLTSQVTLVAGNITTGTDFMFIGTSTVPVGCKVDLTQENNLQMSGFPNDITYKGKVSDWKKNGDVQVLPDGFVFKQGWGTGSGVPAQGSFTWSVGGISTTTVSL